MRELRNEADLSLRELAKQLGGVTAAHLSDIEFGRRHPSDALLLKLARFFKLQVEDLRKLDPRPPIEEIKAAARRNPRYGFAFRQMVDHEIPPEEILDFVRERAAVPPKE